MSSRPAVLLATLLTATSLVAQTSSASTTIDQNSSGCQGSAGLLTGGVAASADITVHYDAGTGMADIVVDNTTPVVPGEATAVIVEIHLNLPNGAITSASLVDQSGSGGATPAFSLSFDGDTSVAPDPNRVACFGKFNISLDNGSGVRGAIANAAATNVSAPNPVIGPVTFSLQLDGSGRGGINAESILASFSEDAPAHEANAMVKFQAAGVGGEESGFVGSRDRCRTAVYSVGTPNIGETIDLCITGGTGCHACLWVSLTPGPTAVGMFTVPIGFPIITDFDFGDLGVAGLSNPFCFSVSIPNRPSLVGLSVYFTNLTFDSFEPLNLDALSFSPAFELTIGG